MLKILSIGFFVIAIALTTTLIIIKGGHDHD